MRVLHVLANSPPDVNGYAVRTQNILAAQLANSKIQPVGLTSPWYPDRESMSKTLVEGGISYLRCLHPARMEAVPGIGLNWVASRGKSRIINDSKPKRKSLVKRSIHYVLGFMRPVMYWIEERILFKHFRNRIVEVAKSEQAEIIHAHVPYRVGIPSMQAARILNLPFVYEMRGLWEESAIASGRWRAGGIAYRRFRRLENKVLKNADAVVCISNTLRDEAISRGVEPNRIFVVPNAVNHTIEPSQKPDLYIEAEEKLANHSVVGYIGSLRSLEGVNLTANAVAKLRKNGINAKFFVLSSESGQADLREYCRELGIDNDSYIVGPVPHGQVSHFYKLIDVFVVSRPDTRVTRLVTPLKPFEAMYHSRPLVMSDLPALAEIVENGENGILYPPGNLSGLVESISSILADKSYGDRLGKAAREWIISERTWPDVCTEYDLIYSQAEDFRGGNR